MRGNQKPEPRARVKARRARLEAQVKKVIRAQVVARDGACLIASRLLRSLSDILGPCDGPSEWAHIGVHRRCFTRGLPPAERHTTAGSAMLCKKHHMALDAHEFDFETDEQGMDGMIGIVRRAA